MELVASDRPRQDAAAHAPVGEVVAGVDRFARDVDRILARRGGNTVFSPPSIAVAFAMASAGARGRTVDDIARVFGFPDPPGVHEAMNALGAGLDGVGRDEVVLAVANSIWLQAGFAADPGFLDTLAAHYGAGLWTTDFVDDPDGSRRAINGWVAEATRDRIPELLKDPIPVDTAVMLVNAVYLKAAWATAFSAGATEDRPFHRADGATVPVPTMRAPGLAASHVREGGYTAVSLPYAGGRLAMLIVVPDEGTTLDDLVAGLPPLPDVTSGLRAASVDLALPRWESRAAIDLGPMMTELGLRVPGGDMGGIAPGFVDARLGSAVHAADITVDEVGTEAAAATAVGVQVVSFTPPPRRVTVTVDRPFLFAVRHVVTGAPLFVGRVLDPTA